MRRYIERKRLGEALEAEEWEAILGGYMAGSVDDAQMSAMAMACVWRGLSTREAAAMTRAMVASGETISYPNGMAVVDKHSSGGVSDIVSLIVVPLVSACGLRVAKLSGRALGHTGGTIDKLETIPCFNVGLSSAEFVAQVERIGCAIAAQSDALVPADKRLYKLRDRTGTVPSLGLIASSIVSKKVASGASAFVFDVKCGRAAFMREPVDAIELAHALVDISREFGKDARAVVSDMHQPLGHSIGTGIEVIEARDFLRGTEHLARARELCMRIATEMLALGGVADGAAQAERALVSGAAYEKFVELVEAQGSTRKALEDMQRPRERVEAVAPRAGYICGIDTVALGNAGRKLSDVDPTAGVRTLVKIGDAVEAGQPLAELYGEDPPHLASAFEIGEAVPPEKPLIYETV